MKRKNLTVKVLRGIVSATEVALASIVPGEVGDVPRDAERDIEAARDWAREQLTKRRPPEQKDGNR